MTALIKPGDKNFYVYSSVSPLSGNSFSLFLPWVNTETMNLYLQELSLAFPDQELLLIMDQAGWHKAKDLAEPTNVRIELLPPYSPELNPVERLWLWLRRQACRNRLFQSEEEIMDGLEQALGAPSPKRSPSLCSCSYLLHAN